MARALGKLAVDRAEEGEAEEAARLGAVITKVGRAVRQSVAYRRKIEDQVAKRNDERAGAEAAAQAEAGQRAALAQRNASRGPQEDGRECRQPAARGSEAGPL